VSNILLFILIVLLVLSRGYDTVDGRRVLRVLFPILKGRQVHIHCSDSEWFFFYLKPISVTRITTAQIEIKWDLITKN